MGCYGLDFLAKYVSQNLLQSLDKILFCNYTGKKHLFKFYLKFQDVHGLFCTVCISIMCIAHKLYAIYAVSQ